MQRRYCRMRFTRTGLQFERINRFGDYGHGSYDDHYRCCDNDCRYCTGR